MVNQMRMRATVAGLLLVILLMTGLLWRAEHRSLRPLPAASGLKTAAQAAPPPEDASDRGPTVLYAHNLLLHQGPDFRIYIPWMRGQLLRTTPTRIPTFDNADTFILDIQKGVVHVRLKDLALFLNHGTHPKPPLTDMVITGAGSELQLTGTLHKVVPLPVRLIGTIFSAPDGRVHVRINHVTVLKIPMKGLLGGLHVDLGDLVTSKTPGLTVEGNDIVFNPEELLPPPHIRGELTRVALQRDAQGPYIEAVYGNAQADTQREQQWHNFLQLTDGTLEFGKLTMHHVDLIMIDASKDAWFDLDLINYQAQLVNGITRITPEAGLQIFMPNVGALPPRGPGEDITLEWLKDRNRPPPSIIPFK